MSDSGQEIHGEFGGAFDAAAGAAVTSGGEQALKAGAAFLDSAIGKIIITLVAGVITGGAGAAIVGPVLAALGPTLPALLIGETSFLTDWTNDLLAYTNSPVVLQVPGLSEAIGADTTKAMLYIQQVKIGPKQKEIDSRLMQHDMQGGFLDPPDVFAEWYRTMMLQVIGPDAKYGGTPEELAAKLKIRPDAAEMAIAVWNGTKLPNMSKYDPATGYPKNATLGSSVLGAKGTAVQQFVQSLSMKSPAKSSAIVSGVKATTMAAQTAQPKPPPASPLQPTPFYKTETVHKVAPIGIGGLGLGGALLMGLGAPIAAAVALGAGGATYLLTRKG